jgi:hypothetical protein
LARVISVHMGISVDVSQHRLNHKPFNFISGRTLRLAAPLLEIEEGQ